MAKEIKPKEEEPTKPQSKPKKLSDFDKAIKKALEFNPKKKKK